MPTVPRGPRLHSRAILALGLLLTALALAASAGCGEEKCDCECTSEGKVCASSTEGRTGCGWTLQIPPFTCSPSGCCAYCCDP
jgi:hypothetical protein